MSDYHQKSILWSADCLSEILQLPRSLLDSLDLPKRCIHSVEAQLSSIHKGRLFLNLLSRRPDSEYMNFLNALEKTGQKQALDYFEKGWNLLLNVHEFDNFHMNILSLQLLNFYLFILLICCHQHPSTCLHICICVSLF